MIYKPFFILPLLLLCIASNIDNSVARIDAEVLEIQSKVNSFKTIPIKWNADDTTGFFRDTVLKVIRTVRHCGDDYWECYFSENTRLLEIVTFHGLQDQLDSTMYYYHNGKQLIKHEEFPEYTCSDTVFKKVFAQYYYKGNKILTSRIASLDTVCQPTYRYTVYGAWPSAKCMLEYFKSDFDKYTRWHWEFKTEKLMLKEQERKK